MMDRANTVPLLLLGRTLHGYSFGAINGVIPIYNSEICQPQIRNFTGTLGSSGFMCSVAMVYITGALVHWRWLVLGCSFIPGINFILLIFAVESPVWFVACGREKEARACLLRLRDNKEVAENEFLRVKRGIQAQSIEADKAKWKVVLSLSKDPTFVRPLLSICAMLCLGQNAAGVAALGAYLNKLIIEAGIPANPYWVGAGLMTCRGALSLLSSFYVPYFNRKTLYLIGASVMILGNVIVGLSKTVDFGAIFGRQCAVIGWLPVIGIFVLFVGYGCGMAHAMMCFQGELLPSSGRAIGAGLFGIADSLVLFAVAKTLPALDRAVGLGNLFFLFGLSALTAGTIVFLYVPETRGKTLEEIEEHYQKVCYGTESKRIVIDKADEKVQGNDVNSFKDIL